VIFAVGFVLYGTTQLLPQMVQDVLNYTATYAGLVITPGGFAVMAMMPLVGLLLGKVQARNLIALGFVIEAVSLFGMSGLNSDVAFRNVALARVVQASGIAFLFVPTSTVAYVGLAPGKNNNASALINLSRNIGGSFGISLAQTWLAQRSQFHQSRLVEHLIPYDPVFQQSIERLRHLVPGTGQSALAALNRTVQLQATIMSYIDIYYLLAWIAVAMLPVVLLLNKVPLGSQSAAH
jgi:DHA2 family multidrug resistance protein